MNKKPAILLCAVFVLISSSPFAQQKTAVLTEKNLKNDISYYQKTAAQKNLNPSDRYYVLQKILKKYRNSKVNLAVLDAEINKVKPKEAPAKPITKPVVPVVSSPIPSVPTVPAIPAVPAPKPAAVKPKIEQVKPKTENKPKTEQVDNDLSNYKIETGDVLSISVRPAKELSQESAVKPDGTISMPLIGNISAQGATIEELTQFIEKGLSVYVTSPKVSIGMKSFNRRQVFIMGEVNRPGSIEYRSQLRLYDSITIAGGLTKNAGIKNIKVHRGEAQNRKTLDMDLESILKTGDFSKDFILEPGDIVEIPKEPKKISIIGEVRSPGSYDWRANLTVLDVVSTAGGPTDVAKLNAVKIFRGQEAARETIEIDLKSIIKGKTQLDIKVEPGDIVYIPIKGYVSNQWLLPVVMPWLTLVAMVLVIASYMGR
ncbi:MAG: SLBB domain-containing protein [Elusimicrobia bacterium]|nr:SLBB domain-containing protein [Elusimicrobiota bacterium]MBU2614061.1 SLBB domain-containing protein [Elusimicrobiota bacterium]